MSLRNKINENPAIPVIGVLIALAVCGYFVWGPDHGAQSRRAWERLDCLVYD